MGDMCRCYDPEAEYSPFHMGLLPSCFSLLCYSSIQKTVKSGIKTLIPAGLFFLQNTLLFVSLGNLDAGVYIVINQLKIFTTAVCSVVLLGFYFRCSL